MTASPPDHTIAGMRERYGARYRWLLLLAVMVGTMASVMSSTVVNVAIPDLSAHFALGQERAQWVSSGFMSAMTVSMLCTPWLLARFGYRATYGGCMWLLLVGGVVGGLAPYFPLVLAARMAEGLAAGVVQPIPAIIILRAFDASEQGRASGIFGTGVVLAPALGPSIGGLLVDAFGWRSIFFMVVPFCVLSFWLARRYVPTNAPGQTGTDRDATLDWGGLVLAAACTLSLLNGLVDLSRDAYASGGLLLAAAGLVLVVFVVQQRRMLRRRRRRHDATPPLMNLGLFADRRFAMGSIVAFIYGTALFGSTYLLPVYMQMGLGMSASLVGAILLPAGLVLAVAITLVGRLVDRYATHRLVSTGLALLAVSFALMSSVDGHAHGTTIVLLAAWAILGRIGLGFVLPSLNVGAMRGLARADIPQGASVINFLRMLGGAAGVSLCGIVLEWRLAMRGEQRLAAFDDTFLFLAAVCALAMLAAWQLRDAPARRA
jgi:EmrB/QacA subfamily drug resistance transporter